ncbi:pilus assembly protein PilS [Photobacterium proteolyticum]|uniref:Pilus assembly protein PilS n=1 Tax=Photobacterium proteolyticum TaxID=1903952 RepID=A0A1Q9GUN7_9GAMM|nr:PilN domain-containing protein [Photobacterium proteolyticum]OLQ78823.1 pilus assembly protein PilS [Photobacterium proteolyticum]
MIARLNLLPWREEKRKQHKQRFFTILAGVMLAVAAMHWVLASYIEQQQAHQQARNQLLQHEISTLERQLAFLPGLDRQRAALNKRLGVIGDIQQERNQITLLLSILPGIVPQGVYLDSVSMSSNRIAVNGIGDSTGRLAILLSNAEQSPWLEDVAMHSIVATKGDQAQDQTRFNASFTLATHPESASGKTHSQQGKRQ